MLTLVGGLALMTPVLIRAFIPVTTMEIEVMGIGVELPILITTCCGNPL
jgi:hypothetical protein